MLAWEDNTNKATVNGNVRFSANEKRIINGHTDVNQLVPFKYKWAWDKYLATCANHWMPQEVQMSGDIALWKSNGLSEDERRIVKRNLGFFVTADSLAANNIVLGTYRHITAPECRQFLLRQAFEEAIHCYAEGTEILTPRGFVDFRDLQPGDKVAQYHKGGVIDFVAPDEILKDRYKGNLVHLTDRSGYELLVTPNHRCPVFESKDSANKKGKLSIKTAEKLELRGNLLPVSGRLQNFGKQQLTAFERLKVAFQADGYLPNSHVKNLGSRSGTIMYQFCFRKRRKIERLLSIVDELGLKHKVKPNAHATVIFVWLPVSRPRLKKDFSWIKLDKISCAWCRDFIEELSYWDGCDRDYYVEYVQKNEEVCNQVAMIAHLAGYRATVVHPKDCFHVHVYYRDFIKGGRVQKTEVPYNGYVYCVGVPTGMIVVRYNGKICVSGNTHAYQYIVESLSMDESEIFNAYREVPSIKNKDDFLIPFIDVISDPNFKTGTKENNQKLLKSLIVFACLMEGLFFYVGFTQILALGRQNKMKGAAKQYAYILRDESMHCNFGIDLINQIKAENPDLWTKEFAGEIVHLFHKAVDLECAYADDTMPRGVLGMNASLFKGYLQFIANRRSSQIGMGELFKGAENTFPWMSEMLDLRKETNFFEDRVTDYQVGGLEW